MLLGRLYRGALRRLARRLAPPELSTALELAHRASNPIFPNRNLIVAGTVPTGRVLVLSPHPDDEAIGMGGTLAMHAANGSEVTVLYLTDGGGPPASEDGRGVDRTEQIRLRREESQSVGRDLGIRQVFWDNADTRLKDDTATIDAMTALLEKVEPEHVYAPSLFDNHFDHFATNRILGATLERLRGLEATVAGYEVWDTIPFPNYLVEVSSVIEKKDAILARYTIPHRYTDFTDLCRKRASVHFTLHVDSARERAATGFAEAFLRFDTVLYRETLAAYVDALRSSGSELGTRR